MLPTSGLHAEDLQRSDAAVHNPLPLPKKEEVNGSTPCCRFLLDASEHNTNTTHDNSPAAVGGAIKREIPWYFDNFLPNRAWLLRRIPRQNVSEYIPPGTLSGDIVDKSSGTADTALYRMLVHL